MATAPQLPRSFTEAARLEHEVEAELERVCLSPAFRSSKRSCEFLRYVVRVALDGRMDSLKERSIGIDLLGRNSSYEPSTDATVRVRANEVRKRLASYYGSATPEVFRIDLPAGAYVPRFLPTELLAPIATMEAPESTQISMARRMASPAAIPVAPLAKLVLMRPALIALAICVLLLRQQLESREDYLRFWDHILTGRSAVFLSVPGEDRNSLASGLYPLIWMAGRYGVETDLNATPMNVAASAAFANVRVSAESPSDWNDESRLRWLLNAKGALTDRSGLPSSPAAPASHRALLTILPESAATLYVQGTDEEALRRLFETLTTSDDFPKGAIDPVANGRALQLLVQMDGAGHWTTQIWGPQS